MIDRSFLKSITGLVGLLLWIGSIPHAASLVFGTSLRACDQIQLHIAAKDRIWIATLDVANETFSPLEAAAEVGAIAMARSPDGRWLAATNHRANAAPDTAAGDITLYRVDRSTGKCLAIGTQSTQGRTPCYVSFDRTGRHLFVANFRHTSRHSRGSIVRLPLRRLTPEGPATHQAENVGSTAKDWSPGDIPLGAVQWRRQHEGAGPMLPRQAASHPHSIVVSPQNDLIAVGDLGIDRTVVYSFDAATAEMQRKGEAGFHAKPGSGPRHVAFHPSGRFLFVIHENTGRIDAFSSKDPTFGQRVSSIPPRGGASADLEVHPSGKWLYGSNRRGDNVMVIAVDGSNGILKHVQLVKGLGSGPRELEVTPDGRYLLVTNTGSGTLVLLRIDRSSGRVVETGQKIAVEGLRGVVSWCPP